jgi:hypothetical protein
MELILVELDAGTEYVDATECAEVTGAELIGDTDLSNGRGRRMERGRDGRHESGRWAGGAGRGGAGRVCPTSEDGAGERSPSHEQGRATQGGWGTRMSG